MSGLNNGKRMFGVGALCVLLMSAAGCTELFDEATDALNDMDFDLYLGDTSEVTLEIYHGESLLNATANYTIVIELDHVNAPFHADNFRTHTLEGNYNDVTFHRVIDDFMIQGGGFEPSLTEKSTNEPIENEANNGLSNMTGTLAMARTSDPHSASSQFFINVNDNLFLDHKNTTAQGWGYAVFGRVTEGMDTINKIKECKTSSQLGHQDVPDEDVVINTAKSIEEN